LLKYKIDVLQALKNVGYNTNKLRIDKIFGQGTITQIRHGVVVAPTNLDKLCALLHLQPGDIIEWVEDKTE